MQGSDGGEGEFFEDGRSVVGGGVAGDEEEEGFVPVGGE